MTGMQAYKKLREAIGMTPKAMADASGRTLNSLVMMEKHNKSTNEEELWWYYQLAIKHGWTAEQFMTLFKPAKKGKKEL